jgi:hypothetical protein
MRQCRRGRIDSALGRDLQDAFESELNLTCRLLTSVPMCHDAGPFNDLGDEAFVGFFRRIPDADLVVARIGLHMCLYHGCDLRSKLDGR